MSITSFPDPTSIAIEVAQKEIAGNTINNVSDIKCEMLLAEAVILLRQIAFDINRMADA